MSRTIHTLEDLTRPELEELEGRADYKSRWLVTNVITAGNLFAVLALGVVTALDVIPRPDAGGGDSEMIWPILAIVGFLEIPMMGFVAGMILKKVGPNQPSHRIWGQGFTAIVICLAFSVSIAVYGLVGSALGMPKAAQLGLVGLSAAALVGGQIWVRGRVRPMVLIALAREARKTSE